MSAYDDAVLADLPASGSYWKLDETSGNAADSGGGAHTGTSNSVLYRVAGPIATEQSFGFGFASGLASSVDAGDVFEFTGNQVFSIDFWMRTLYGVSGAPFLVNQATAAEGWNLRLLADGTLRLQRFQASAADSLNPATTTAANGKWHHVAITYDATNMNMYLDGPSIGGPTASAKAIQANAATFRIGAFSGGGNGFGGHMSHVAVYPSVTLTAARVQAHYDAAFTTTTGWYAG